MYIFLPPGTICCAGVFHSRWMFKQRERMLDSSMVMFNANSDGHVSVGRHTPVTRCDVTATNGVVHVIDQVLPAAVHKYARARQPEPGSSTTSSRVLLRTLALGGSTDLILTLCTRGPIYSGTLSCGLCRMHTNRCRACDLGSVVKRSDFTTHRM